MQQLGERGSGIRAATADTIQDFAALKRSLLQKNQLFEDVAFPAKYSSLYFEANVRNQDFVWLRPTQIVRNPQFIVEGM